MRESLVNKKNKNLLFVIFAAAKVHSLQYQAMCTDNSYLLHHQLYSLQ